MTFYFHSRFCSATSCRMSIRHWLTGVLLVWAEKNKELERSVQIETLDSRTYNNNQDRVAVHLKICHLENQSCASFYIFMDLNKSSALELLGNKPNNKNQQSFQFELFE